MVVQSLESAGSYAMNLGLPLAVALTVVLGAATALNAGGATTSAGKAAFPISLFKAVAKGKTKKNVLVSPLSVSTALTMAYMGAAADTKKAMASTLDLTGTDTEAGTKYKQTLDSLRQPGGSTKLEIANALFARQKIKFKEKFLDQNKQYFNAKVTTLDFKSPTATATINKFVADSTHNKIKSIVDEIPENQVLYLVNAIYFKGSWDDPFDKGATTSRDFHLADGTVKKVPMMREGGDDLFYFDTSSFQAIKLGYADKRLSMCIFLPKKSSSLDAFEAQLDESKWNEWKYNFRKRPGLLTLPKFTVSDGMKLNPILAQLGMGIAFDPRKADFSGINVEDDPYISEVMHKTFMEVNEEGTEAAAVTSIGVAAATGAPVLPPPFIMNVDRPFFIAIHDSKTDNLLFVGHIADPSAQ
jgi:serpin B